MRAVVDLNPSKFVRETVLKRLKKTRGFVGLAPKPPRGFGFQIDSKLKAKLTDRTKTRTPNFQAEVALEAGQVIRFGFSADLRGGKLGDAHIFHLTQDGPDPRPQGGLTVVMLAI